MQVDQIPIFNKKGTQYFMDLSIGTPRQPFTVIFDTGSAVFGIFTSKDALPSSIRSKLSQSSAMKVTVDSMNSLKQWDPRRGGVGAIVASKLRAQGVGGWAPTAGQAVVMAMSAVELDQAPHWAGPIPAGGGLGWAGAAGLALLAANMLAAAVYVRRRRGSADGQSGSNRGVRCVTHAPLEFRGVSVVSVGCH